MPTIDSTRGFFSPPGHQFRGSNLKHIVVSDDMPPAEKWLINELNALKAPRYSPPSDPNLGADFVCYNVSLQPNCYDFTSWLIDAEMTRVREGAPAPLKVWFVSGSHGRLEFWSDYQKMMIQNVMRPMVRLIGGIEDQRAAHGRGKSSSIVYLPVVQAAKRGEPTPVFRSPLRDDLGLGDYVTITLREFADDDVERNSHLAHWLRFADYLRSVGQQAIFVRDSRCADEPLPGYATHSEAAKDLHVRMAFYEQARCNFFVSNGPWNLALFSQRPWFMFVDTENPLDFCNNADGWRDFHGVAIGEQFPWSAPNQRIIWKKDDFSNLCEAWESLND